MLHVGDITKLNGAELPVVDIVCGGSPCQDLSVAGKRAGLAGERSGLFMEQIRLVKEMRENDRKKRGYDGGTDEHIRLCPRYMVWENVNGALSSGTPKGEDFRIVLEETAKVADKDAVIPRPPQKWESSGCILGDGWSIAWRTHDAQYWGVPQRRKRICMVADFDGDTAGKILFDVQLRGETEYNEYFQTFAGTGTESRPEVQPVSEGLSGDSEPCESEREGTAGDIERCSAASSYTLKIRGGVEVDSHGNKAGKGPLVQTELSATLGVSQDQTLITGCLNSWDVQSKHIQPEDGIAEALYSGECRGGGGESYVMQNANGVVSKGNGECFLTPEQHMSLSTGGGQAGQGYPCVMTTEMTPKIDCDGTAFSLRSRDYKDPQVVVLNDQGGQQMGVSDNVTAALRAEEHGHQPIVFEPGAASRVGGHVYEDGISGTVRSNAGDNQQAVVYGIDQQGGKGMAAFAEDVSPTMASDSHGTPHAVCYGISSYDSNAMKSNNPHSGIYEAETSRTLDLNGGSPACNQGGVAVVYDASRRHDYKPFGDVCETVQAAYGTGGGNTPIVLEGNGQRESHMGNGFKESETMYTLNTVEHHAVCFENHSQDSRYRALGDTSETVSAKYGTGGNNQPLVVESLAVESHAQDARYNVGDINQPVCANMEHDPANGGLVLGRRSYQETTGTLSPGAHAGSYNGQDAYNDMLIVDNKEPAPNETYQETTGTIDCCIAKGTSNQLANNNMFVANQSVVRRLTPMECERLQGYPDHWTDIGEWVDSKGKKHKDADSPRYKALGNSIAVPFWQWMAERMVKYLIEDGYDVPTMASLFDGIGGFPLAYSRCGCKPIWASEIEEFPIAVTKIRFPEE